MTWLVEEVKTRTSRKPTIKRSMWGKCIQTSSDQSSPSPIQPIINCVNQKGLPIFWQEEKENFPSLVDNLFPSVLSSKKGATFYPSSLYLFTQPASIHTIFPIHPSRQLTHCSMRQNKTKGRFIIYQTSRSGGYHPYSIHLC